MVYASESDFETYIRSIIKTNISANDQNIHVLKNKKAVDILIHRKGKKPDLFFIEVKYHRTSHGRLGFGNNNGGGFQPEILKENFEYFENNLRWVIASDTHQPDKLLFLHSNTIRKYLSGGSIGEKFNNIQAKIFENEQFISEEQFISNLKNWLI